MHVPVFPPAARRPPPSVRGPPSTAVRSRPAVRRRPPAARRPAVRPRWPNWPHDPYIGFMDPLGPLGPVGPHGLMGSPGGPRNKYLRAPRANWNQNKVRNYYMSPPVSYKEIRRQQKVLRSGKTFSEDFTQKPEKGVEQNEEEPVI